MIPRVAGLAQAVDAYCERIGFSQVEVRALFEAETRPVLRVKLHAEQLSNMGGAALAADYRALSADYPDHADEEGILEMAEAGVEWKSSVWGTGWFDSVKLGWSRTI